MPRIARSKVTTDSSHDARGHLEEGQLKSSDKTIGAQVRQRRVELGLSQEAVAGIMELTFQQLQKYEHGTNRISGSRLFQLATILQVPILYFFEAVEGGDTVVPSPSPATQEADTLPGDIMKQRKTGELIQAFYAIEGEKQRMAALTLLKSLGKSS